MCQPPRGNVCVEIRSCPFFADLLDRNPIPRPRRIIKFIRDHHCGFQFNTPKVCCHSNNSKSKQGITELKDTKERRISEHKNIDLLPKGNCGKLSHNYRITDGSSTSILEFPWMALIAYDTSMLIIFLFSYGSFIFDFILLFYLFVSFFLLVLLLL